MPPAASARPLASLSVDLDDHWAYLRTRGDRRWETLPTFLDRAVPRLLDVLAARGLTVTVFVVGQDAALARNRGLLRAIADAGHEIASHGFGHAPWLPPGAAALERELVDAEAAIEGATGVRPRGFRGPAFVVSGALLTALARRGYLYDATMLPTVAAGLARRCYLHGSGLDAGERRRRVRMFGGPGAGRAPLGPYRWAVDGALLEIPVTTVPGLRLPMHASVVAGIAGRAPRLARSYLAAALALCRRTGTPPSVLVHALDLLGGDEVDGLAFVPGMRRPGRARLALVEWLLDLLVRHHEVVTLHRQASLAGGAGLPVRPLPAE